MGYVGQRRKMEINIGSTISFSGTHGTGKSTAAMKLADIIRDKLEFTNLTIQDGIARKCSEAFSINQKTNLQSQQYIFCQFLSDTLIQRLQNQPLISARSIWDNIAYLTCYLNSQEIDYNRNDILSSIRGMKLIASTVRYDYIFLLSPENDYCVRDGIRDIDRKFRNDVHEILINIYNTNKVPYILVDDVNKFFDELDIVL